ncbi:unnamed protein product, partial [Hapterophycus canaliculatus]
LATTLCNSKRCATTEGPFGGIPAAVPGTIAAVEFDYGGQGVGYSDETLTGDNPRTFRPQEGIDLVEREDGSWYVGYVDPGEWVRYTVEVSQDGEKKMSLRVKIL